MLNKLFFLNLIFVLIFCTIIKANEEELKNPPQESEEDPSIIFEKYLNHLKNPKRVKREFYGSLPSYQQLNQFLDGITGWVPRQNTYYGPPAGGR
ncbi:unnamed protein product [Meloidogyne enterolobii]|uniref:Uncharacterized protein n=1 Tax=Meloidogyne enterolobii TaxID=390850 RepID=A0ACB0Y858_MELEN